MASAFDSLLVGRSSELVELRSLIEDGSLVSVVGPGGVGKTTLVLAAISKEPAALVAHLTPFNETDLRDSIAGALRYSSYEELRSAVDDDMLLVLDNCEHVLDGAVDVVVDLLAAAQGVRIVTTSREPLGIQGERVVELRPLSTDGHPSPAGELFVARMRERGVEIPEDLSEIEGLCRRLDGLPLALELAAARTSGLTPAEIAEHLEDRLDLLARRKGRGDERHRSLTAAVGWSYQLLDDELKSLFLELSVFVGLFTAPMAVAISGMESSKVTDLLLQLVDRSLLVHEPADSESWYRMLSTIRAYGQEKLIGSDRWAEANERLVGLALRASDRLAASWFRQDDPSVGPETGRLFRVLRSTIQWCLDHDETPDRAKRLVAPLWAMEDVGNQGEAADIAGRVIDRWDVSDAATFGQVGQLNRAAGRFEAAETAGRRSLECGGEGVEFGYRVLGMNARAAGRYDEAIDLLATGAEIARTHGSKGFAGELDCHRGLALVRSGEIDAGLALWERVVDENADFPMVVVIAQLFAASTYLGTDVDKSLRVAEETLDLADSIGYDWAVNHCKLQIALARYVTGDTMRGISGVADSLAYSAVQGSRSETWMGLRYAASILAAADRPKMAGGSMLAAIAEFGTPAIGPTEQGVLDRISSEEIVTTGAPHLGAADVVAELRSLVSWERERSKQPRFVLTGDVWDVSFEGANVLLSATKGMGDLHQLMTRSGEEVSSMDLMGSSVEDGDAGPLSDTRARRSYETRIRELQTELDDAARDNDPYRAEQAKSELDALVDHLSAAYGLSGTERTVGTVAEKARTAVTWRIRSAIKKISGELPALGDHLGRSVRTGRFCSYDPAEKVDWQL